MSKQTTEIIVSERDFTNLVAKGSTIKTSHRHVDILILPPKKFDSLIEARAKDRIDQLRWLFAVLTLIIAILLAVILWG